jgi:choline-glycine betaine transporter
VLSITVLSSVPLIPIMVLLCVSLVRWLNEDFGEMVRKEELCLDVDQLASGKPKD